ncbi:hypothetical protein RIF29_02100 [Crotalaria pallida]|uniref:Senescence-associated protein n=1 Tax=Crotalaria pallida TaxID=3830 RepID=A0AAN9P8G9_CROPI
MIGRADIEGSKSNVAMNAWLPQASYPCGNFSDTSSFKFRRTKGSIGHAFTVRIRTGNQNKTSFYPFVPHEISVLVELILGHLRNLLTDVPPQPNSPPDNVFRSDRPAEADLGSKNRGNAPPPIHGIILSQLFDARGRGPEGPVPNPSPDRHAATRSRRESSSSSPPTADGFGTGTPVPSPQSQSFSRGYGSILPTSLAYIVPSTRGCSPWRPDAAMSTTGRGRHSVLRIFKGRRGRTGHHATCGALPAAGPYLRLSHFQGGQADRLTHVQVPFTWNLSPLRPSKFSFEYLLLPPRSAPTAAPPGLTPQVLRRPSRPPTHRGLALAPTAGYRSRALAHPFSGLVDSAVSLRASTRVSSGFAPLRHSSPSFGSRQLGLGPPSQFVSVHAPSRLADRLSPFHIRPRHIAGPHPLPSRQFQALFDSLFKVLFIFPSRYLFAIGLSPVFSLGRNLPPDWGCIPKQPDSPTAPRGATGSGHDGALTLSGAPFQGTWARSPLRTLLQTTIRTLRATDSHGGLFPRVAPPDLRSRLGRPRDAHGSQSRNAGRRALSLMASGATCVQRLDGSRDSAIHTKYRILLRSSSMQEPRYPLPRVFQIHVSHHRPHEHRLRADGGALNDFDFLGAFGAGFLLFNREETDRTRSGASRHEGDRGAEHL